jgi:hypothetical protein
MHERESDEHGEDEMNGENDNSAMNDPIQKAVHLTSLAEIAAGTGDFERAIMHLREAFKLKREALGVQSPALDLTLDNLDSIWAIMQQQAAWHSGKKPLVVKPIMRHHD